jgi:hypothetical protein
MSRRASRRGFIGSTLATVAVAPCALAGAETAPATPDATKVAVEKAVTECREASFEQRLEADAAYGKARKCPYAEAMRRHGAAELGFAYSCAYDIGFCQGLNPAIRFTRTKTLMMGDSICDHTYELPRSAATDAATDAATR